MRENTILICPVCKREFVPSQSAQKYCCVECRVAYYANLKKKTTEKYECACCGTIFESDRRKKYCSVKCQRKGKGSNSRTTSKKRKSNSFFARISAPKKKKNGKLTLAEINELARSEGLNYGQYVAKYGL